MANLSRCPLPPAEPSSRREEVEVEGEEAAEVRDKAETHYRPDLFDMMVLLNCVLKWFQALEVVVVEADQALT